MGKHHHHHGGGRRRRLGRGGFGPINVIDAVPEYVDTECILERLPNGRIVKRCPVSDALGFQPIGYLKHSDAIGFQGPTEATRPLTEYMSEQSMGAGEFSNARHVGGPATKWFQDQRFAAMTFNHGQDYMTNVSGYRKRLPDGSWKWCYPGDEARGLTDDAGDIMPTLVTADTAKQYIAETDAGYDTLDHSIAATTVPQEFQTAWKATYVGWKGFAAAANASVGFFTAKAVMDQTDRWVQTLGNFSIQFHQLSPSSPVPTMPAPAGQGVPDKSAASLLSGSTGLVLAGALLAGVLVFGKVAK